MVIPVDYTFNMRVTRNYEGLNVKHVSENSIHGKWLLRMAQAGYLEDKLNERIGNELKSVKADRDGSYPIGTIATIETPKCAFLLLSVSKFDSKGNAQSSPDDITHALEELLRHYDEQGQAADLYLPLIGTGLSRARFSARESFELIKKTITEGASFIGGKITLVLLPEDAKNIGLLR